MAVAHLFHFRQRKNVLQYKTNYRFNKKLGEILLERKKINTSNPEDNNKVKNYKNNWKKLQQLNALLVLINARVTKWT